MTIEELKALEKSATPIRADSPMLWMLDVEGPDGEIERWEDRELLQTLRLLAPELLLLVEAAHIHLWDTRDSQYAQYAHDAVETAIDAFNAKLAAL